MKHLSLRHRGRRKQGRGAGSPTPTPPLPRPMFTKPFPQGLALRPKRLRLPIRRDWWSVAAPSRRLASPQERKLDGRRRGFKTFGSLAAGVLPQRDTSVASTAEPPPRPHGEGAAAGRAIATWAFPSRAVEVWLTDTAASAACGRLPDIGRGGPVGSTRRSSTCEGPARSVGRWAVR
jgi:hypothetical protein